MRKAIRLTALAAGIAAGISCGDVVRQGSSPMFLVLDQLQGIRGASTPGTPSSTLTSDVITNVTSPAPCSPASPCPQVFGDTGTALMRATLKNIGSGTPLTPTSNNDVTITRIHVDYTRSDGRNTPGVDVPFPIDSAVNGTIVGSGSTTIGFELVRNIAKEQSPLVQLKVSPNIMSVVATVTVYGVDRTGNQMQVSGQIQIEFGNFGDQ